MKLYATVSSERGKTIGKGGQEFLKLHITDSNQETLMIVAIEPYKDSVGDGTRAEITCANHLYTTIYGEQITTKQR